METVDGGTSEGKKKRWTFQKLKETRKDRASSRATSYVAKNFISASFLPFSTALRFFESPPFMYDSMQIKLFPFVCLLLGGDYTKDANLSHVKTYYGHIAAGKLEKSSPMELMTRMDKPAYRDILPSWSAPQQSWLAQAVLPGARFQKQHGFSPVSCIGFDKVDFGSPVAEHMSSSDIRWRDNLGMDEVSSGGQDMDRPDIPEIEHDDTSSEEDMPYQLFIGPYTREEAEFKKERERDHDDDRNKYLLKEGLTPTQKVLGILHMIQVRKFTEYDPKQDLSLPYRFCEFNMAFFDLDKESKVEHGPLYQHHPKFDFRQLDYSVNVILIKVAESDVPYPINIYGTVLARDQYDYRCVYLFKRGRDDPQLISSPDDMLTLIGPYRALAGISSMFFEFHLKIKSMGTVDQDFSKGFLERNPCSETDEPNTLSLDSYLSTVDVVYMPVVFALEGSIGVNILGGKYNFTGEVAAWTTQTEESKIILYDSEVAGTQTKLGNDGAVSLTRHVVAVPQDECLVIGVSVYDGNYKSKCHKFVLGHGAQVLACNVGPYELEFKIIWKEVRRRRPKLCEYIDDILVLWE